MHKLITEPLALWARSELRRRWAGLVVLGLLGGLAAGLTIAAVDGSRRSTTSYERMREHLLAADAIFFPSQVEIGDADVTKLAALPEVAAWGGFALADGRMDGFDPGDGPFYLVGSDWFTRMEKAKVVKGRTPDPARDDEVVITDSPEFAKHGVHLGSVLTSRTLTAAQQEQFPDGAPADFDWVRDAQGPVTEFHVVGVVRLPLDPVVSFAATGLILPSPTWAEQHLDQIHVFFTNAFVRLNHGAADIPAFQADVAKAYARTDIPIKDLSTDIQRVNRSVDLERTALLLFAAAVAIAGFVIVGQSLSRSIRAGSESVPALSAMGLPTSTLVAGLVLPHLLTIAVTVVAAAAATVLLSQAFPIGLARQLDPSLGIHANAGVLVVGLLATLVVALLATVGTSYLVVRAHTHHNRIVRTRAVGAATKAGLPVPAAVGFSLALERGPSRTAPVRPALIASIVGILGVVGGVTLVKGIDDAVHDPGTTGSVWDLEAETSPDADDAAVIARVTADPTVTDFSLASRSPTVVDGKDVPLYAVETIKGGMTYVVLHGRAPHGDGETALGPATAKLVHAKIGDTVTVGPHDRPVEVVGIALLPQTPHTAYDEGAWVSPIVVSEAADDSSNGDVQQEGLIRLTEGTDAQAWADGMSDVLYASPPAPAADVVNLDRVRSLPLYLAAFLCLLAIGAAAHALLSGTRRRAHELAVLRAVGLTPAQSAWCVAWQAGVIGVVALAIGIPIGLLVGREFWRLITDSLSAVYRAPLAPVVLLVISPIVLGALTLMALWPARAAAKLHTAQVLRSE